MPVLDEKAVRFHAEFRGPKFVPVDEHLLFVRERNAEKQQHGDDAQRGINPKEYVDCQV